MPMAMTTATAEPTPMTMLRLAVREQRVREKVTRGVNEKGSGRCKGRGGEWIGDRGAWRNMRVDRCKGRGGGGEARFGGRMGEEGRKERRSREGSGR